MVQTRTNQDENSRQRFCTAKIIPFYITEQENPDEHIYERPAARQKPWNRDVDGQDMLLQDLLSFFG